MMETDVFFNLEVERKSKMKAIECVTFIEIRFSYMTLVDRGESSDLQLTQQKEEEEEQDK